MSEAAIQTWRETDADRMVVHYMQPLAAFITNPEIRPSEHEIDIWKEILRGNKTETELWRAYRRNLSYVLEEVSAVLNAVSADPVVITADHGNAVGEWGLYGHPPVPIDALRDVPWVETTAERIQEYDSSFKEPSAEVDVDEQLRALGYR